MKHSTRDDEVIDLAALYALGALPADEARAFEQHLAEGCGVCEIEVRSFTSVAASLAYIVPAENPPGDLRRRMLARATEKGTSEDLGPGSMPGDSPGLLTIRALEGEWRQISEGVLQKILFVDPHAGTMSKLVKMLPGATFPLHRHSGIEQCLVLEGDFHVNGETLRPMDYHCAPAGSVHEAIFTERGTLLLIVAPLHMPLQ